VELRQLRYFVTVAEELHFSRAAARLHLAQSALSAQIRRLEEELGGPLLLRSTRRVSLTPAGEALLTEGRAILAACDGALQRVAALARGDQRALVIGSLGPVPGSMLSPLLARFGGRRPQVRVEVRALDFSEGVHGLRNGRIDLAFVYAPLHAPDVDLVPLLCEQRVVVLPREHRLSGRPALRPADLARETFVVQPDAWPQEWRDFWTLVDELGHRPPTSPYVGQNIEDWLHLIGRGEGIDTCPAIIARYFSWPEVVFVPLLDAPPSTLVLAVHHDARGQPLVEEFIDIAVDAAANAARNPDTAYTVPGEPAPVRRAPAGARAGASAGAS
jgi:LysR family transcriptional regulator, benzoate and cis,cis-muconate-responsive activator of ben and cat genes